MRFRSLALSLSLVLTLGGGLALAAANAQGTVAAPALDREGPFDPSDLPPPLPESTGSRFYVAPTGDDSRSKSEAKNPETPWRTIQRALDVLDPSEVAVVREGTYSQSLVMDRAGTPSDPITIMNYPGEHPIVRPGGSGNMDYPLRITAGAAYVRFSGFIVEGSPLHTTMNIWISDGQRQNEPPPTHNIEISRCEIRSGIGTGVLVSPNTDSVQLIGNSVHDNGDGSTQHQGLYFQGQHGLIANNVVYHQTNGFGIQVRGNYPDPDTERKIPASGVIVASNTVVDNSLSGIMVENNATYTTVVNNISAFNGSYGVRGYNDGSGLILPGNYAFDNLAFGNHSGQYGNTSGMVIDFSAGNLVGDPLFADPDARDYHLLRGSPGIDTAIARYSPPTDFDGTARPQGPASDIGAYER